MIEAEDNWLVIDFELNTCFEDMNENVFNVMTII